MRSTTVHYVQGQIQRLESRVYNEDDCLYRIASAADLIVGGEQITDDNRTKIKTWVTEFKTKHGTGTPQIPIAQ